MVFFAANDSAARAREAAVEVENAATALCVDDTVFRAWGPCLRPRDEEDEEDPQKVEDLRIKAILGLQETEGEDSVLSLLLLEELGGYLPMGKEFTKEIR